MRSAMFATLCLGLFAACDHGTQTTFSQVTVQWMEWPAEVNAGQPFRTRLVVWTVCALNPQFRAGAHADPSAVTFEPYYLIGHEHIACITGRSQTLLAGIAIDTAGMAPGLAATSPRSYEMRGTIPDYAR